MWQEFLFVYTVRVFRVPLLLCCVPWLFLVFILTILGFASMGDCFYGVWMRFLQVLVFVCKLVAMPFLRRSCVFSSISLLFIVESEVCNVLE